MTGLCLVAIDGDMSRHGMCSKNQVIPIMWDDRHYVCRFVEAQQKLHNSYKVCSDFGSSVVQKRGTKFYELFADLRDRGVFTNKWEARTTWSLEYYGDDELQAFEPWEVCVVKD